MINWNNLLKCLAFGILVPISFLCLLHLLCPPPPVMTLVLGIIGGVLGCTTFALGKWNPFD